MRILGFILWTLYILKFLFIIGWLWHSVFLMSFPYVIFRINLNVVWNIISSLFVAFLDLLGHMVYCIREKENKSDYQKSYSLVIALFWFLTGPVLLGLTLFGSLTDSINYDLEICRKGCALSIFLRDFHLVILFSVSIISLFGFCIYSHSICFGNESVTSLCMNTETSGKNTTHQSYIEPLIIEGNTESPLLRNQLYIFRSISN